MREAAQQFEALLVQNMLKNMRAASGDEGLFGSSQMDSYYEMFDQQVALEMARKGGLGLADVLVGQMTAGGEGGASENAADLAGSLLRSARSGQLERAARELPAQETAPAAATVPGETPASAR